MKYYLIIGCLLATYLVNAQVDYSGQDLTGQNFANQDLSNANFTDAILASSNLNSANLTNANLTNCVLSNSNLENTDFTDAILVNTTWTDAWFDRRTKWSKGFDPAGKGMYGPGLNYSNQDLTSKNFYLKDFLEAIFQNTILVSTNLVDAKFEGASLSGADLSSSNLERTDFTNAILENTTWTEAWFDRGTIWPTGFDPAGKGMYGPGLDYSNMDFTSKDFYNKDFQNAIFQNTVLVSANLTDTKFDGANLTGADLTGSSLERTDFTDAILLGTDFSNTILTTAIFTGAKYNDATIWPDGFDPIAAGAIYVSSLPSYLPSDGLVAWYPFNGNANDESGNGNNGNVNDASLSIDRFDNDNSTYQFDGIDDVIRISSLNLDGDFSISLWFIADADVVTDETESNSVSGATLIQQGSSVNPCFYSEIAIGIKSTVSNSDPFYSFERGQNCSYSSFEESTQLFQSFNEWVHVVYVKSGSTLDLYENGILLNSYDGFENLVISGYDLSIGARWESNYGWFKGKIDDIGFWNRGLSKNEIDHLFISSEVIPLAREVSVSSSDGSVNDSISAIIYVKDLIENDNIISYEFELNVPSKLSFDSLSTSGTLSEAGIITHSMLDNKLSVAWASSTPIFEDSALVRLHFTASSHGDYQIKPSKVILNTIPQTNISGGQLSIAAQLGDVDVNGQVQAYDAALDLQYSVGIEPLPELDSIPFDRWRFLTADVDQNGEITAYDASLILQKVVGLIDSFPDNSASRLSEEPPLLIAENDTLVLSASEAVYGLNLSIEVPDGMIIQNPIITEFHNSLHAYNLTETSLKIGMASVEGLSNILIKIPYVSEKDVTLNYSVTSNTFTTVNSINVSSRVLGLNKVGFVLYPNPSHSTLILDSENPIDQVSVFGLDGKEVMKFNEVTEELDISSLPTGTYILKVTLGGISESMKFIKN